MRAFLTRGEGIDAVRRAELPLPSPGPREVLVRMRAVSLNFRDLLVIKGVAEWKPSEDRIPVSDGVGEVVEVGTEVTRFRTRDRVAGIFLPKWLDGDLTAETFVSALGGPAADGVMVDYRVFDERSVVAVSEHLTDAEAATLPVAGVTAWHAIRFRSDVRPGDRVVIQGTGGVSLFALQLVHAIGGEAIVISGHDEKLERAKVLGAAATINYSRLPAWEDEVLAWTGGRGVDHVIEVVGGENLNRSLRVVRVSGTISFIGVLAGLEAPIRTQQFIARNVRIHGIEVGSRAMFEDLNRFLERHAIHPVIDTVFPFQEFPEALRRVESARHFGKVVVGL